MEKNSYFIVENKDDGMFLKIIPEEGNGQAVTINDIMYYLDAKQIQYDLKQLNNYLIEIQTASNKQILIYINGIFAP